MRHPTPGIIISFGSPFTTGNLLFGPFDERKMQFGEVRHLCRPMIHLKVDVQMIITIPGRIDRIAPKSLQIRRQQPYTGGRDQQVAAELEIERT